MTHDDALALIKVLKDIEGCFGYVCFWIGWSGFSISVVNYSK